MTQQENYFDVKYLSASKLKAFASSKPKFTDIYLKGIEQEETDALAFGTATHTAVLEPEKFSENYVFCPDGMSFATKEGKEFKATHAPKQVLNNADTKDVIGVMGRLAEYYKDVDGNLLAYLRSGEVEKPLFANNVDIDGYTFDLRAKPDVLFRLSNGKCKIVDLKTASAFNFTKPVWTIHNMKYHLQAGLYYYVVKQVLGLEVEKFEFIFVEKSYPHACKVVNMYEEQLKSCWENAKAYAIAMQNYINAYKLQPEFELTEEDYIDYNQNIYEA